MAQRTRAGRVTHAWRRLWDSVAFRLTFNYSLLAVCTTTFLLIFAYGKITDVLQTQFQRQVVLTTQRLMAHQEQYGRPALRAEIMQLLSDQTDIDTEMYLLLDEQGGKLAGNLEFFAAAELAHDTRGPIELNVLRHGKEVEALLGIRRLNDGSTLVVGRDTQDMAEIRRLIGNAVIAAMLVALLLVMIGTVIFRRALGQRVAAIRDTAVRVGTGQLARRIPVSPQADEFEQLRGDINRMLDRIELLMSGVRNVSDSIAHNIRTPLARVLAGLDRARHGERKQADLTAAIDAASGEIMDLITVAEKLLLIAEAESGVRRQAFRPTRLEAIVQDVIELYEPLALERGTSLTHTSQTMIGVKQETWVMADADLLAGVLANLVDNAMKFTGPDAHIRIKTERQADRAILTVTDSGHGVGPEHLDQLGTRFFRLEPEVPGSGLGLASVRAIVSLHNGILSFEDAQPGLRARIEFPLHDEQNIEHDQTVMIR
ncbi:sensor histidine kinase [Pollutimonas harenae]|uniref:histidine kinase n=1 Tax=Pollutimonas harenae TaxID=657015 RepID=A0A853GV35_9BURK|nr:ATP-binding protein [Pollutimonas harenae]NYT85997.1 HAMP domain-containing protein [Pollutimonas harenae]TEA71046.1 HAMP domain-containing protein [Pollutimonas harenae]